MPDYGIAITRTFDAPRERVWAEWTTPAAFADWFGAPLEVPLSTVEMDVREGGSFRLTMLVQDREIHWAGTYREVQPPARLVFTITDRPERPEFELVTVELIDLGGGRTEMRFQQRGHMRPDEYERAGAGWGGFFDRLAARL